MSTLAIVTAPLATLVALVMRVGQVHVGLTHTMLVLHYNIICTLQIYLSVLLTMEAVSIFALIFVVDMSAPVEMDINK